MDELVGLLVDAWPAVAALVTLAMALTAAGHAILHKQDSRATVAWVGVIWLAPLLGPILYALLGINRIRRRAARLRQGLRRFPASRALAPADSDDPETTIPEALAPLARLGDAITHRTLLPGNRITPLVEGDAAFPAMLDEIERARRSITLITYIFGNDATGTRFAEALGRAVARGVAVRVLVDALGARHSFPTAFRILRRAGVPAAGFMPTLSPWALPFFNLRTHRKILVVDGRVGFTGGMNISEAHRLEASPPFPVRDLHFRIEGPVVTELQEVFAEDWNFSTDEVLEGEPWFPAPLLVGESVARAVDDGPDDTHDSVRQILLGAISVAQRSVRISSPYFLPDATLINALVTAALRGVAVDILMPARNNHRLIHWASFAQLDQLLYRGCRVHLTPEPFDHSKLMVVDRAWTFFGSANWDPRSLSLNFELNMECYDPALAADMDDLLGERIAASRSLSLAEVTDRGLPRRLRDGLARLLSPYL